MTARAADAFEAGLTELIARFRLEWDLTYSEALGVLVIVSSSLAEEARASSGGHDV